MGPGLAFAGDTLSEDRTARLEITCPDGKTRTMPLEGCRFSVGRASDNDLSFGSPEAEGLSRHHFVLERCGAEWSVEDLKSKNGTFVNGERLTERRVLRPGDRITASTITLVFSHGAPERTVLFETPTTQTGGITASTNLAGVLARETAQAAPVWNAATTALLRAGRELGVRRPLAELFQVILDLAIESVAATRGVLLTIEKCGLVVQATRGEGFRISTTVRDRVLEGRTSLLVLDTSQDEMLRRQDSIVVQSVHSFMAVPLQTDDRVMGLIYADTPRPPHQFTTGDLDLLTVMANVAAIRIERERLAEVELAERRFAAELEQAADIQRRFLPACPPMVEGLELAGHNAACRMVGGDYYDYLAGAEGKFLVVIGDVAGKGLAAALMMMNLQARVQALADSAASTAALVMRLNRGLAATCPDNRFVTFFMGALDLAAGELRYANAGHNPPLLVRRNGAVEMLGEGGPVLGIFPEISYEEARCALEPGDLLLLYSDGVTEALNPAEEEFGEERLVELVSGLGDVPAAAVVEAIRSAVENWAAGHPAADDVTVVAVRRTG
jgi:serine phosphatase RsbU (regulator of sigma subunit)